MNKENLNNQYNRLANKINISIKKQECIDRIYSRYYEQYLGCYDSKDITDEMRKEYFKVTGIYKNQYDYLNNYISEAKECLLNISIKINEMQLETFGFCVIM